MIDDSQDLESIARMLRQEREHLIDAWEQLESEQRQLALTPTTGSPTNPPPQEETRPVVEHASSSPPREGGTLPPPPAVVRTVRAAKAASASNTFRFLQREFDKPDEERSP